MRPQAQGVYAFGLVPRPHAACPPLPASACRYRVHTKIHNPILPCTLLNLVCDMPRQKLLVATVAFGFESVFWLLPCC